MERGGDDYTNCIWCAWNNSQRISKGTGSLGSKRTCTDQSNNTIIKISQDTEKSPGDLIRVFVSQTPVKDHQLRLVGKTLKYG